MGFVDTYPSAIGPFLSRPVVRGFFFSFGKAGDDKADPPFLIRLVSYAFGSTWAIPLSGILLGVGP